MKDFYTPEQIAKEFKRIEKLICCQTPSIIQVADLEDVEDPVVGVFYYNTDENKYYFWNGVSFEQVTSAA